MRFDEQLQGNSLTVADSEKYSSTFQVEVPAILAEVSSSASIDPHSGSGADKSLNLVTCFQIVSCNARAEVARRSLTEA